MSKNTGKPVKTIEKDRVINELKQETQVLPNKNLHNNYKTLSWDDLREMNNNKLFTIAPTSQFKDEAASSAVLAELFKISIFKLGSNSSKILPSLISEYHLLLVFCCLGASPFLQA